MAGMGCSVLLAVIAMAAQPVEPRVEDVLVLGAPAEVKLEGFLGSRCDLNRTGRLKHAPIDEMLAGFQKRPGSHPWIGEHIGKWLHAASLAWQNTRDSELRAMMDRAVRDLLATQKPDGYLGTYDDKDRWTSWDVWVHKYNLIGLLAYHEATGDAPALSGARRVGDLLCATFGPAKRDIIASGTHVGMAATSVLEPMVGLYRVTGDEKHLAFCRYLVESWDQAHGPKIIASLLTHGKVARTANAKAYEMMSNLVGLCELYRVTGEPRYLKAAQVAWQDINDTQLYVTGGTSLREHFQPDGHTPSTGAVAETCANVTWEQLSAQLYRLTGEAKYAAALERLIYNHLIGAQGRDGRDWCYFTVLEGAKTFTSHVNCCHSSGPRGVTMVPELTYARRPQGVRVTLYEPSQFRTTLADGTKLELRQETKYPAEEVVRILVTPEKEAEFAVELRVPEWMQSMAVRVNGEPAGTPPAGGVMTLQRTWKPGDAITIRVDLTPRWIQGTGMHEGYLAAMRGPFVLCVNGNRNPDLWGPELAAAAADAPFQPAGEIPKSPPLERSFSAAARARSLTPEGMKDVTIHLTPFALVQNEGFTVWIRTPALLERIR